MRPNIAHEIKVNYAILGGVVLLGLIALLVVHDWGAASEAYERTRDTYTRSQGHDLQLAEQVKELEKAKDALAGRIEDLKGRVGLQMVMPFVLSEAKRSRRSRHGEEFFRIYNQVRDKLREKARRGNVEFNDAMGFGFLDGKPPPDERAREHMIMLQLVSKAVYMALHTPNREISSVQVLPLMMAQNVVLAGPSREAGKDYPGRDAPLMREFHFGIRVVGSLHDQLWLLHRLSLDQPPTKEHEDFKNWLQGLAKEILSPRLIRSLQEADSESSVVGNEVCPLVVTDCRIASHNAQQINGVSYLTMELQLSGMEFLDEDADWEAMQEVSRERWIGNTRVLDDRPGGRSGGMR